MSPRIALFMDVLGGGGAERVIATLANGFYDAGYAVDVILVQHSGEYLKELHQNVSVIDLKSTRTIFALFPLVRYLRRVRPVAMLASKDYVNIVAVLASLISGVSTSLAVREAQTPSISDQHSPSLKSRILKHMRKWLYSRADIVIAPSQGVADDLINSIGIAKPKISVIGNPLDLQEIDRLSTQPCALHSSKNEKIPIVLGMGRLTHQKDFSTLIRAVSKVLNETGVKLVIVGEGDDRADMEKLIRELGIHESCELPGFVGNPYSYLKNTDVFVLSSRWEGLPNALLQALAVGTPVVSTDCPSGPREILEHGRWGRLVPIEDVDAMASAIVEGVNGQIDSPPRELIEQRYGLHAIVDQYLRALKI